MKRAFAVVGMLLVLGIVAWLAVTRHLAIQRADRLDRALMEAEARLMQLDAEAEAAQQRGAVAPAPTPGGATRTITNAAEAAAPTVGAADAAGWNRFAATASGVTNLVRIEGTSSVHNWQVEGHLIGGSAEFAPGFPVRPADQAQPGGVEARVTAFIPVRSLKSVQANGSPYSTAMDEIMYGKLLSETNQRITYRLSSLTIKEPAKEGDGFVCEAAGLLAVAGITNTITMPVTVAPQPGGKIRFRGVVRTKMTDFNIIPPAPSVGGISITTGDEVTLTFEWSVAPVTKPAAK